MPRKHLGIDARRCSICFCRSLLIMPHLPNIAPKASPQELHTPICVAAVLRATLNTIRMSRVGIWDFSLIRAQTSDMLFFVGCFVGPGLPLRPFAFQFASSAPFLASNSCFEGHDIEIQSSMSLLRQRTLPPQRKDFGIWPAEFILAIDLGEREVI